MKDEKLIIKIDATEWRDETFRDENIIEGETDIYKGFDRGLSTAKLARAAVVSREVGKAPDDIIRPNLDLLSAGAVQDIIAISHKKKVEVAVENGKTYQTNAYVGKGNTNENGNGETEETKDVDDGPSYVDIHSKEAIDRALLQLSGRVSGNIWSCLLVLQANDRDVKEVADALVDNIYSMVKRITEPSCA